MVASTGEAGSAAGVGEGATGAGVGVGDGLGPAGLDAPGRRGVCATATIINKTATRAAEKSLRKFIQASFCRERGGARLQSLIHWATIIFEEPDFGKTTNAECAAAECVCVTAINFRPRAFGRFPAYQSHQHSCQVAAELCAESATHSRSCAAWMAEPGRKLLR